MDHLTFLSSVTVTQASYGIFLDTIPLQHTPTATHWCVAGQAACVVSCLLLPGGNSAWHAQRCSQLDTSRHMVLCVLLLQRLHPNHEQPRNAFTKYDNGWMLFFKQASTSYSSPTASGPTGGPNGSSIAAGAAATYAAFMAVCHRPFDHLQAQQQQRAAGVAFGGALPYHGSAAGGVPAPNPWGSVQQQQQQNPFLPGAVTATPSSSSPSSPALSGSPFSPFRQQQAQQQYYHAGLHLQPAGAPPAAAQRPAGEPQVGRLLPSA